MTFARQSRSRSFSKSWAVPLAVPLLLAVLALLACKPSPPEDDRDLVGIVELLHHSDVTAISKGLQDRLSQLNPDVRFRVLNANDQQSQLPHLFQELSSSQADVIVPIFTPTAQAAANEFLETPIVFAAVTDPVGAGIVASLEEPGGNVTGVSDQWPVDKQLNLIVRILPDANRLGVLFNPSEQNSQTTFNDIQAAAERLGLSVVPEAVPTSAEVLHATQRLAGQADVLYTANTISVASALDAVITHCQDNDVPFFAGDKAAVEKGAIATVSQSYYDIGVLAAGLVDRVLRGASPQNIPVIISRAANTYYNTKSAEEMGVELPESVLREGQEVGDSMLSSEEPQLPQSP